jgi:MFS family permease
MVLATVNIRVGLTAGKPETSGHGLPQAHTQQPLLSDHPSSDAADQRHGPIRPWSAFKFRDFSLLWASGITMMIVMQLRLITTSQWLFEETGSAATLGYLGAIQLLQLPAALYGGALADVIDRKKLMAMTQFASFTSLVILTLLAASDQLAPWHVFVVTGVVGIVNMLGNSARPAMLPRVVPRAYVTNAVTIQTASFQVAQIVAPLLFILLYKQLGVTTTFLISAVVAGVSVLTPMLIRASGAPQESLRKVTWASLREGFTFVKSHRILPGLYLLDIGITVFSFYRMLFPVFAEDLYGLGAEGTGALNSANAIGAAVGSFIVFFTGRWRYKGRIVLVASLIYALLLFGFGLNPIFWVGLVIVAGLGMMDSVGMTMRQAVVQLTTPDRLIGRASSAHSFAAMGANHAGQFEVGLMSAAIGAGPTMVLGGAVALAAVGLVWWLVPGVRRYRYVEQEQDMQTPAVGPAARPESQPQGSRASPAGEKAPQPGAD